MQTKRMQADAAPATADDMPEADWEDFGDDPDLFIDEEEFCERGDSEDEDDEFCPEVSGQQEEHDPIVHSLAVVQQQQRQKLEEKNWRNGPPDNPAAGVWPRSVRFFNQRKRHGRRHRSWKLARLPTPQLRWMLRNGLRPERTGRALTLAIDERRFNNSRLLIQAGVDLMHHWAVTVRDAWLNAMLWMLEEYPGRIDVNQRLPTSHDARTTEILALHQILQWYRRLSLGVSRKQTERLAERMVECLVEQGADPNAILDPAAGYAFSPAPLSYPSSPRVVELLLAARANPDFGHTPEERPLCVHWKQPDSLKLLLRAGAKTGGTWMHRFDSNLGRLVPVSLLALAIPREAPLRSLELLIEHGAPLVIEDPQASSCAFRSAVGSARYDSADVLRLLLRYPWPRARLCCTAKENGCVDLLVNQKREALRLWQQLGHPVLQPNSASELEPALQQEPRQKYLEPAWRALEAATGLSGVVASLCLQAWVDDFRIRIV